MCEKDIFDVLLPDIWRIVLGFLSVNDIIALNYTCTKVKKLHSLNMLFHSKTPRSIYCIDVALRRQGLSTIHNEYGCEYGEYLNGKVNGYKLSEWMRAQSKGYGYKFSISKLSHGIKRESHHCASLPESCPATHFYETPNKKLGGIYRYFDDKGEKEGYIHYYKNGRVEKIVRVVGDKFEMISYYNNRNIRRICQLNRDFLTDGQCIDYYEDKVVEVTGFFKNGKPLGIHTRYYRNGKVHSVTEYEDNEVVHSQFFYPSGELWKDLRPMGVSTMYYKNGRIWVKWLRWKPGEDCPQDKLIKDVVIKTIPDPRWCTIVQKSYIGKENDLCKIVATYYPNGFQNSYTLIERDKKLYIRGSFE